MIKIKLKKPFNFDNTITCGQIFRFYKQDDNSYDIILDDRVINVIMDNDELCATSNDETNLESKILDYFDLENDYDKISKIIMDSDIKIADAVKYSDGLMMIHQSPFETIIEYIISANNGVPQISNAINEISKKYGKKIKFNNKEYYLFPSYFDLKNATSEDFRSCKVGFRDKYIYEIVQRINDGKFDIEKIFQMNTEEALEYLMQNNGIGSKVASCILLFAYKKYDVFPIDTWVKKIMKELHDIDGEKKIRIFAKETYKDYSGIAIQYLFNYSRNK